MQMQNRSAFRFDASGEERLKSLGGRGSSDFPESKANGAQTPQEKPQSLEFVIDRLPCAYLYLSHPL
jgi:hypothetical protein